MNFALARFCASRIAHLVFAGILTLSFHTYGLTITSTPVVTKATNAPLAGTLQLTTDENSRISVTASDGNETWQRNFYDYTNSHSIKLLGFKANRTYQLSVTAHDQLGNQTTATNAVQFITAPLPSDFPKLVLLTNQPAKMEPGYTLFVPGNLAFNRYYIVMVDHDGEVVWYTRGPANPDIRQLPSGDLLFHQNTNIVLMNMLGQNLRVWPLPPGVPWVDHELFPTDHGTFLTHTYATRIINDFPASSTDSNTLPQSTAVWDNPIIEISTNTGALLNTWPLLDLLSPTRISYHTFINPSQIYGWDWAHANGIIEDPRDGLLIASVRHQSAVVKFTREGQIKWILGPHENWPPEFQKFLLTPVGTPFLWQYAEHAPVITPQGTLLLFDNGNYRAMPFDALTPPENNYSRAVEYEINENTMEVSQIWEYGRDRAEQLFSDTRGNADWLPLRGHVMLTFADITYANGVHPSPFSPNARMARIIEVTHNPVPGGDTPDVVFDLAVFDYKNTAVNYRGSVMYRSKRVPDLYPVITIVDQITRLKSALGESEPGLISLLDDALMSINSYDYDEAALELRAFQDAVQAQVSPLELVEQLVLQAQQILDALAEGDVSYLGALHFKNTHLKIANENGMPLLQFLGDESSSYTIQASDDIINWENIGNARHIGNGYFDFEDEHPVDQARFYRIVTP